MYAPVYLIWFGLSARAKSFFFFAASNPTIRNGGFLNESKKEIATLMPSAIYPKTIFFSLPCNGDIVLLELYKNGLSFPLIGKPDVGGRGRGVKVLTDEKDVRSYVSNASLDFHVQEFVPYKNEVGVFYYRFPGEDNGRLSGIVRKEFLKVKGDGVSSINHLIQKQTCRFAIAGVEKNIW